MKETRYYYNEDTDTVTITEVDVSPKSMTGYNIALGTLILLFLLYFMQVLPMLFSI